MRKVASGSSPPWCRNRTGQLLCTQHHRHHQDVSTDRSSPPGRAIVELDYSQIEVGICAAEHHDEALIRAFNSGDVYAAVAQQFYVAFLTEEERLLSPADFKKRHPELRDKIKTFVLAVLYNMQAQAVADRFRIPRADAEHQRQAFLSIS